MNVCMYAVCLCANMYAHTQADKHMYTYMQKDLVKVSKLESVSE
jgi:hypothetical protein